MHRLLIVTTLPSTICAFLTPFARHFRRLGWHVDALAAPGERWNACSDAFDQIWQIEWSRNPLDPRYLRYIPRLVREIVERENYDLVHIHTPIASFITRYALRNFRKPVRPAVIYTAHGFHFYQGGSFLRNNVFLAIEKLAGRWTDYLVVINQEDHRTARRHRIMPPDRIWYMPGIGVDLDYYCPDIVPASEVARVRQELSLSSHDRLFLMIAEFVPNKRPKDALDALAALRRSDIHVAFAGDGALLPAMQQLAVSLGLERQTHFLGHRQDIPALIRASVATLLLSQREGLPRSIMESLSLEIPVIGANNRGVRDLLSAGGGLIVEVGDIKGLARAMAWMADNPERAKPLGRQGRAQMAQYDLRRIIMLHEELYVHALSHRSALMSMSS